MQHFHAYLNQRLNMIPSFSWLSTGRDFFFNKLKASCDVKFLLSNFKLTNFKLATVESEVPNY